MKEMFLTNATFWDDNLVLGLRCFGEFASRKNATVDHLTRQCADVFLASVLAAASSSSSLAFHPEQKFPGSDRNGRDETVLERNENLPWCRKEAEFFS